MIRRQLVIVGAGPAGMSAAIAAAEAGLGPLVIDENPRIGGQIYRQPPAPFHVAKQNGQSPEYRKGSELRRRFESLNDRIDLLTNTTVWGTFPPKRLAVVREGTWEMIETKHLVLAPGAYEYVPPFPDWTLPGVMTPGGAQIMVKTMHTLPGRRVLLAGTGPFLLVVANHLQKAGVEVVGIVEAVRTRDALLSLPGLLAHPGLLWQGWRYVRQIQRSGIPSYRGHVILEAKGDDQVREVVFAPCDQEWYPDLSRARTVAVDTLCVGYGFVPRIQLAQMAGCELQFKNELGGWIPHIDDTLQTSVPGIWVAGDGAGVAGALVAELEGTLAGLAVAHHAGAFDRETFDRRRKPVDRQLAKLCRFRAALDELSRIRPGLSALATKDTLVCRCEELTLSEVQAGIAAGGTDVRALKVMTRLGMGPCQGRMCSPAMSRYIALGTGKPIQEVGPLSVRPPIKPVTMGDLAAEEPACSPMHTASGEVSR